MKLNKKLTSILVTGAMIASIGGTTAMTSFAEEPANPTPKVTAITKTFQMPVGTTTPSTAFTFNFAPKANYGSNADMIEASGNNGVFTKTLSYTDADEGTVTGDVKTVIKSTDAIFDGINDEVKFPHAGRYAFTVTEANVAMDGLTCDTTEYTIYVSVANGEDGLYVKDISVTQPQQKTDEEGKPVVDNEGNPVYEDVKVGGAYEDKDGDGDVDEFDGTEEGEDGQDVEVTNGNLEAQAENGFGYTNTYVKATNVTPDGEDEDGEDPDATDDNTGLYIQKNVAGDFADKTQKFTFSVTVTAPSLSNKTEYKAVIFDLDEDKAVSDEITFTSGAAKDIQLTDQQRLVFKDLDIGAKYEVTEAAAANYTAAVNGEATNAASDTVVDTEANQARYVNTYDDEGTTPTGILMQNAPYILVATLAAGGLVIYLAKRREEEEEA